MPQKICTLCLSYLKHAATFRQQVLTNIDDLRFASGFSGKNVDIVDDTSNNAITIDQFNVYRNTNNNKHQQNNFNNNSQNGTPINNDTYKDLKEELDLFFCDNNPNFYSDSDDDQDGDGLLANELLTDGVNSNNNNTKSDQIKAAINNFFNYTEKTFEEDDIGNFDNIIINIPDEYRERKCNSCKQRFMLNDSYDTHLKECIQKKLFDFINDSQQLLLIKKHKAISSAEFVRRMIFSLKNIVKSLALSNRTFVVTSSTTNNNGSVAAIITQQSTSLPLVYQSSPTSQKINALTPHQQPKIISTKSIANNLLQTNEKIMPKKIFQTIEQNVFCSPKHKINKSLTSLSSYQSTAKIPNFVAKCPLCMKDFDSLQALEMHNRQRHNKSDDEMSGSDVDLKKKMTPKSTKKDDDCSKTIDNNCNSRQNLLKLLNDVDYRNEGIVDVVKLRQKSPNPKCIQLI